MDRTYESGAAGSPPSAPASPSNGYPTAGNPQTATPATKPGPWWYHMMTEELRNVITSAGLTPDHTAVNQLTLAIQALFVANQKAVVINSATFEASVADGEVVRWDSANTRFDEAVADGTANNRAVGIADVTNSKVYLYGECALFSGLTPGARYYLDASTPGAITDTAPTDAVMVGIAKSATVLWVDVDTVPTSPVVGKNLVINGGFTVNQRAYVSGAALAAGVYGHDRWKAGAGGGNYTFTQLDSNTEITIAANKTLIQVIWNKNVQKADYVVSWTGTALARAGVNSATPSGSYSASPLLITGQTPGTVMSVEFGNGASAGTLGEVQITEGATAADFEFRSYEREFELCTWYYERISFYQMNISSYDSNNIYTNFDASGSITKKRSAPTVALTTTPTIVAPGNVGAPITGFSDHGVDTQGSQVRFWAYKSGHGLTNSTGLFAGAAATLTAEL